MPWNLREPPSDVTGPIRHWLMEVRAAINRTPVFSYGSLATPEGSEFANLADFYVNLGSASTLSRLFFKSGPENTVSNTSWVTVRILA